MFSAASSRGSTQPIVPNSADQTKCCGCEPLNPESNAKLVWDIVLVGFLLYVAVMVPMRLSFDHSVVAFSLLFWFEAALDLFFIFDISEHSALSTQHSLMSKHSALSTATGLSPRAAAV